MISKELQEILDTRIESEATLNTLFAVIRSGLLGEINATQKLKLSARFEEASIVLRELSESPKEEIAQTLQHEQDNLKELPPLNIQLPQISYGKRMPLGRKAYEYTFGNSKNASSYKFSDNPAYYFTMGQQNDVNARESEFYRREVLRSNIPRAIILDTSYITERGVSLIRLYRMHDGLFENVQEGVFDNSRPFKQADVTVLSPKGKFEAENNEIIIALSKGYSVFPKMAFGERFTFDRGQEIYNDNLLSADKTNFDNREALLWKNNKLNSDKVVEIIAKSLLYLKKGMSIIIFSDLLEISNLDEIDKTIIFEMIYFLALGMGITESLGFQSDLSARSPQKVNFYNSNDRPEGIFHKPKEVVWINKQPEEKTQEEIALVEKINDTFRSGGSWIENYEKWKEAFLNK
ncbi:hypothetical protein KA111_00580 [Candidatus Woesebacteria bacterium]|nr:hypothetical protein [Candidatus Woesebacteria bacterium]